MATFTKNGSRLDPYKNFKFRIKWASEVNGTANYVAGVSKISALKRTTEVIEHRAGGDASSIVKAPGQTKYEPITLERGVTHDEEFELWANKVWSYANAQAEGDKRNKEVALSGFRKNLILDIFNEANQKVQSYQIFRCWPKEFTALPELDANANAIAIQSLVLENEGWIREVAVKEPEEPDYLDPEG